MLTTLTNVDVELGPLERSSGVTYLGDAQLDNGPLSRGDNLTLRDEGGICYNATVMTVEPGRYGQRYRVSFVAAA